MTHKILLGLLLTAIPSLTWAATTNDPNSACRIPFTTLKDTKTNRVFPLSAVQNPNTELSEHIRLRYIVGDFNSTDQNGLCRGVHEQFSAPEKLSDFKTLQTLTALLKVSLESLVGKSLETLTALADKAAPAVAQKAHEILSQQGGQVEIELADLANYATSVERFATRPVNKGRVDNGYCIGENLNYCEILNPVYDSNGVLVNGTPTLMYKFVTSTSRQLPPPAGYYAPINFINTRHWSLDRPYTTADADRDERMGGSYSAKDLSTVAMFRNGGSPEPMPNFMNFHHLPGYSGENENGIHEIAGGLDSGGKFGAPVSLGCVRLNKYQAKLSRWWTPHEARFFIYMDPSRYFQRADASSHGVRDEN